MDITLGSLFSVFARRRAGGPKVVARPTMPVASGANRLRAADVPIDCWADRIWLDRREALPVALAPATGLLAYWQAARRFVVRMQLGPVPGTGAERGD